MKQILTRNFIVGCSIVYAFVAPLVGEEAIVTEPDWSKAIKSGPNLEVSTAVEEGISVLKIQDHQEKEKTPRRTSVITSWKAPLAGQGISFEVKGDGSTFYGSLFLGDQADVTTLGYEALFPLASTDWQKVTLRWEDFVQNYLPYNKNIVARTSTLNLDPGKIRFLGFGTGCPLYKYYPSSYSLQVRNIRVEDKISPPPSLSYDQGLSRTISKIKNKQPLKILLLGDSITDLGGDHSYGYFCAKMLKETYGIESQVVNAGIGGQSVRYGTIILPRSLRTMPDPDLVCIMFGANDCKETEFRPDFTADTFRQQISALIARVRQGTGGQADIILLSGVPRLDDQKRATVGVVEKIAPGIQLAAEQNQTGYVDTLSAYLGLESTFRATFFLDTIHQNPKGLEYIGTQLFQRIKAEMER
ncbi:MAG: GDSL-type esterase/lipase family protein [Verrucomicrobiota bacterium]